PSSGCSRSERDSMQSGLQPTQLIAEIRVRSGDVDVGCDGVDRQRQNGAGGKAAFLTPRRQLFAAAGVDDSPESDPCMGRRAHLAVFARAVYGRARSLVPGQVLCRPPRDLEFGVARVIAAGASVAIGEELSTVGADQHGPERFVSGLERFTCQLDAAAKESAVIVIEIGSVCHALHPITDRADFSVPEPTPTAPGLSRVQALRT